MSWSTRVWCLTVLQCLQWLLMSMNLGGLARGRPHDAPRPAPRAAGAVELLRSGRLAADHPDWALGAGFSFTPQDGDSEGEGEGDAGEAAASPGPAAAAPAPAAAASEPGGRHGAGADFAAPEARLGDRHGGGGARGDTDGGGSAGDAAAAHASGPAQALEGRPEGRPGPAVGVDLEHSFSLASADALATPFTNYVGGRAPPRIQARRHAPGHRPPHGMHTYGQRAATPALNQDRVRAQPPRPYTLYPARAGTRACWTTSGMSRGAWRRRACCRSRPRPRSPAGCHRGATPRTTWPSWRTWRGCPGAPRRGRSRRARRRRGMVSLRVWGRAAAARRGAARAAQARGGRTRRRPRRHTARVQRGRPTRAARQCRARRRGGGGRPARTGRRPRQEEAGLASDLLLGTPPARPAAGG